MARKKRGRGGATPQKEETVESPPTPTQPAMQASGFHSIAGLLAGNEEGKRREPDQFEDASSSSGSSPFSPIYSRYTPGGTRVQTEDNLEGAVSPIFSRYVPAVAYSSPVGVGDASESVSTTPIFPRPVGRGRGRGRGSPVESGGGIPQRSPAAHDPENMSISYSAISSGISGLGISEPVQRPSEPVQSPWRSQGAVASGRGQQRPETYQEISPPQRPETYQAFSTPPQRQELARRSEPGPSSPSKKSRLAHPTSLTSFTQSKGVNAVYPKQQFGTIGRKVALIANYFAVDIPHGSVFHYDIDICKYKEKKDGTPILPPKPEGPTVKKVGGVNKELYRRLVQLLLHQYGDLFRGMLPVYDGFKNIITRRPIMIEFPKRVVVSLTEGDNVSKFWVTVKPVQKDNYDCEISLEPMHEYINGKALVIPQECIMAMDIILRHGPSLHYVPVGRSFFQKPRSQDEVPLGPGKEIWFGYYQSLRPGWKPLPASAQFYLNIDRSATAFYKNMPVITFLKKVFNVQQDPDFFSPRQIDLAKKKLKGVKVVVTHQPYARKYQVKGLTSERASKVTFEMNGKQVSVPDYFQSQYRIRLMKPNYPCIITTNGSKLPLEVCVIADNQAARGKLDADEGEIMVKQTAIKPIERFHDIQNRARDVKNNNRDVNREFDINISTDPLKLEGRVLPTPQVQYSQNQRANVKDGQWELRGKAFVKGVDITHWAFIALCRCYEDQMMKFGQELQQSGRDHGVNFARPLTVDIQNPRNYEDVERILKNLKSKFPQLQMVLVVLEPKSEYYKELKKISETDAAVGFQTQCVTDKNLQKCIRQDPNRQNKFGFRYYMNLCQKINAKMGGTNSALTVGDKPAIFRRPVMIVGADVTHPRFNDPEKFSIAAVVGSIDSYPSRYTAAVELQRSETENKAREETILKLEQMMKKILLTFLRKCNGHFPEAILYYRDGVSEGQFEHVRDIELIQIRNACSSIKADYKPKITFIVVQKRHHTRFMPENFREGVGAHGNIQAGTIVDRDITHAGHFNFYLSSHVAIQGTSRPGHYNILHDDNDFTADELQKLTFYLCHTYSRCTKSISVPPPVMYADLAAFRAKLYVDSVVFRRSNGASSQTSDSSDVFLSDEIVNSIILNEAIKDSMYYV